MIENEYNVEMKVVHFNNKIVWELKEELVFMLNIMYQKSFSLIS